MATQDAAPANVPGPDAKLDQLAANPATAQFPSMLDTAKPNVEIAERSQDVDKASSTSHIKVFVVQTVSWSGLTDEDKAEVHARNARATRQGLISQGLRPNPDAQVTVKVSPSKQDNGASTDLAYSLPVTPAAIDGRDGIDLPHVDVEDDGSGADQNIDSDTEAGK